MRYDALYALKPLLAEISALTDELVEAEKIKIDDSDLECLRKKTGDRTITVYKELVKEAIKKDMKAVEAKIDEFVCVGVGHCRQLISSRLQLRMLRRMTRCSRRAREPHSTRVHAGRMSI